jgi:GTP-binding protein
MTSAKTLAQCPPTTGEVAFIGRSNVGKSSLLGAVLGAPALVRRSRTPGRTQLLNFFSTTDGDVLVDLPGYGFAAVPVRIRAELVTMIERYLAHRRSLRGVVLLLDARRTVPSADDRAWLDYVRGCGTPVLTAVTKIDRVPKAKQKPTADAIEQALDLERGSALLCSAINGQGVDALRRRIRQLLGEHNASVGVT